MIYRGKFCDLLRLPDTYYLLLYSSQFSFFVNIIMSPHVLCKRSGRRGMLFLYCIYIHKHHDVKDTRPVVDFFALEKDFLCPCLQQLCSCLQRVEISPFLLLSIIIDHILWIQPTCFFMWIFICHAVHLIIKLWCNICEVFLLVLDMFHQHVYWVVKIIILMNYKTDMFFTEL